MRLRILTLLTITMLCSLPLLANAATYNWYFSDDAAGNAAGNDTTGDGSIGNPWKTLSKAKTQIDTAGSGDTVNLYFDRGDTWTVNTLLNLQTHGFEVESDNPIVNMDAYGSGDRPCIDGGITDFSTVAETNSDTGPLRWSEIFRFSRPNCSVSNMEFKQVYGDVIEFRGATGFHLSYCNIHHFGQAATKVETVSMENAIIEYNTVHTGQQLFRFGKRSGWGGGISFSSQTIACKNNTVRYNLVYDIYGEGIFNPGSITEYNVVGDTYSVAIYAPSFRYDASDAIIRYNYVISSNSPVYRTWGFNGIGVIDENVGGSNANADIEIYGNIVINRCSGIYAKNSLDPGNPFKSIKIYNNLVIDCSNGNYIVSQPSEFTEGHIYNNSSILYDRTGAIHGGHGATFPHANWTIENNHFWTTGGSPTVDDGWTTNCVIADPKLPGEPSIDWDGQSGPTYYKDIDFNTHLYPPSDSVLVDAGKTLGSGYETMFLTKGTDFDTLPNTPTLRRISQSDSGNWDIGLIVHDYGATSLEPPKDLKTLK